MVINQGTLIKSGTAATSTISVAVENSGAIVVIAGTLVLDKVSGTGTLDVSGTGRLVLNGDFRGAVIDDILMGSNGTDTLNGRNGNDRLTGRGGNDSLSGGADVDTFVFNAGFGNDVITDFTVAGATHDVIEFSTAVFADWAAVQAALTDSASGAVITAGADTITFNNVTAAQLITNNVNDFLFV
jgi:Ca2+-binding RTX toxin-like protein